MPVSTTIENKPPSTATGWHAELSLGLIKKQHKTIINHVKHQGPLRIQRPFYPESDGTCHVYLLHPPGGIVGGDILQIQIKTEQNTNTLVTTPAATKFYRSNQRIAQQNQNIIVGDNASLEWLPQETIVYNSAYVKSKTHIVLSATAQSIGWDIVCLGRPASGEIFSQGRFRQHIELWRNDVPLFIDRCDHQGSAAALQAKWGMANFPVTGTLFCTTMTGSDELVNRIRETVQVNSNCLFGVTNINGVVVCRYLGEQTEQAKAVFIQAWTVLRLAVLKKDVSIPRIWNT